MHRLGEHDVDFLVVREIVQNGDDRPAIHLRLIDLLRAMIKPGRIAETHRIRRREQTERGMRTNDAALVE